jgi:hypothetical protein
MIAAMKKRTSAIGRTETIDNQVWASLRSLDLDAVVSFRVSDLPTVFAERWEEMTALAGHEGLLAGSPLRGQLRCLAPAVERSAVASFRSRAPSAILVYDALPSAATWNSLTSVPTSSTLHSRILEAFDPVGIMNPGAMRIAR